MIVVHHLQASRSDRIIWLLEELGVPYQLKSYARDPQTHRAPEEMKALNPLGKAPMISDGDRVIIESGAIVEYLVNRYGSRDWQVLPDDAEYADYLQWLHFAEGTAMAQLLMELFLSGELLPELGLEPHALTPVVQEEVGKMLAYTESWLEDHEYFAGARISGADVMMGWVLAMCEQRGRLKSLPAIRHYLQRLEQRPAYQVMQKVTQDDSF